MSDWCERVLVGRLGRPNRTLPDICWRPIVSVPAVLLVPHGLCSAIYRDFMALSFEGAGAVPEILCFSLIC